MPRGSRATRAASRRRRWHVGPWVASRRYDLAINFEGDIRSHGLLALSAARRRVGFAHAGGGPLLTDVVPFDGGRHVADNGLALVERAFDLPAGSLARANTEAGAPLWRLSLPAAARAAAPAALAQLGGAGHAPDEPLLAVHAPGGRAIKQWPVERFADAASALAIERGASVVLTGAAGDEAVVSEMESRLRARNVRTLRVQGTTDLVVLAAMLPQCRALLTGDTGPMHLAAAVGTPVLAIFGPSMPWRYGPLIESSRVVRVDLACSPCNRIRLPPRTLPGTHAGLPCRGARRDRRGRRAVATGVVAMSRRRGRDERARSRNGLGSTRHRHRQPARLRGGRARRRRGPPVDQAPATRRVDGARSADRFTHRGDSLWWFAEIYLHRMRVITGAHRAVAALEHLAQRDAGGRWFVDGSDPVVGHVAIQVAARRGIACSGPADASATSRHGHACQGPVSHRDGDGRQIAAVSAAGPPIPGRGLRALGVCRRQGGEETYVGPVIRALEARVPGGVRWWAWARAPTSACGGGAIASRSSSPRSRTVWPPRRSPPMRVGGRWSRHAHVWRARDADVGRTDCAAPMSAPPP